MGYPGNRQHEAQAPSPTVPHDAGASDAGVPHGVRLRLTANADMRRVSFDPPQNGHMTPSALMRRTNVSKTRAQSAQRNS
jgi:hypothetical protein